MKISSSQETFEGQPDCIKYLMQPTYDYDCFFVVGPDTGHTERIGAFKIFLMGYSEPFRKMLHESTLLEQGDVRVSDIKPETFKNFLKCVYSGGRDGLMKHFSFQETYDLLSVIDKYLVTDLKPVIIQHLNDLFPLNRNNIFIILSNPVMLFESGLEVAVTKIVQTRTEKIFADQAFLNISADGLLWILKQETLITNEVNVWEAVKKWAKHKFGTDDGKVLRTHILSHLKFIRFCCMSRKEFCSKVLGTDILSITEIKEICNFLISKDPLPEMDFICNLVNPRIKPVMNVSSSKSYSHIFGINKDMAYYKESEEFVVLECRWLIEITNQENFFGIYLQCNGPINKYDDWESTEWKYRTKVELVLINQGSGPSVSKAFKHTYQEKRECSGFGQFCTLNDLFSPDSGFIKNNQIIVIAHVHVEKTD